MIVSTLSSLACLKTLLSRGGLRICLVILAMACMTLGHVASAQLGRFADSEALAKLDLIQKFQELGRPDSWTSSNTPFTGHLLTGIEAAAGHMKLQRIRARYWAQKLFADGRANGQTGSYSLTTMLLKRPDGVRKNLKAMLWDMFGNGPTAFPKRLEKKLKLINARHKAALQDTTTEYNTTAGEIGQVTSSLSLASGQYEYINFDLDRQTISGTTVFPVMRISSRVEYNAGRGKYIVQHQGPTGGTVETLNYKVMVVAYRSYILIARIDLHNKPDSAARVTRDKRYQHIQAYGRPIHPFPDDLWRLVTDALSDFLKVKPVSNSGEYLGYIQTIIREDKEGKFFRFKNTREKKGTELKKGDKLYVGDIIETRGVMVKAIFDSYEDKPLVVIKNWSRLRFINHKDRSGGIFQFFGRLLLKGFGFGKQPKGYEIVTSNAITGCSDDGPGSGNDGPWRKIRLLKPTDTTFDVGYNPKKKTTRINLYEGKLKIECTQAAAPPIFVSGKKEIVIKDGCDMNMSNLTASNDTPQKAGWTLVDEPDKPASEPGASSKSWASQTNAPGEPTPVTPATGSGQAELNFDRPGSDYISFDLPQANAWLCRNRCNSDDRCKAWTYVKPNTIQGPNPRCWLKNSVPPARPNTCCVSGVKAQAAKPVGSLEESVFDFETGTLHGWSQTGNAFAFQPTYGDNPAARYSGKSSKHQGRYWIGTFEKRPNASIPAGQTQGDGPTGTLTSDPFTINSNTLSFLVGGGCDINTERVELIVNGQVVRKVTGTCHEAMQRIRWDVSPWRGRTARIRLVDQSSGGWGHINFDDLRMD